MRESYLKFGKDLLHVRHNDIVPGRRTLLFVHGLGDSGLAYLEAFEHERLDAFNLLVPDLIGYGRSSASSENDYSFDAQINRLRRLLSRFGISDDVVVIGHSMGGDITTLMCASDKKGIIKKYVNVEGDVTQHDLFISNHAVNAHRRGGFDRWFNKRFAETKVYLQWGIVLPSARRYYASLRFCRPEAFLASSQELVERNNSLPGRFKSEIGKIYCDLTIPRVFCYGTLSISSKTLNYLRQNGMEVKGFEGAAHSVMVDKSRKFYDFLYRYASDSK